VTKEEFEFLRAFLKSQSGLVLSEDKTYLVESRLMPIARRRGLQGLSELIGVVRTKRDPALNIKVVEAMTTNESFFFRDVKPFDSLRNAVLPLVVPAIKAAGGNKLRIWSAACSSGQEPYSIAMVLKENPALLEGLSVDILGTDLSVDILTKAKAGLYSQFEAQRGLPIKMLMNYFDQVGEQWQIKQEIRSMVRYEATNLLHDIRKFGTYDIVFCRNVLIYFDPPTKTDVLRRLRAQMPDYGALFLGGAETVIGVSDQFTTIKGERGVYAASPGKPAADAVAGETPLSRTA